jgi:dihydroxyacetone kinase-like protein
MGVALTACTVPHAGKPSFDLGEDEIEIGIGIHGEPGRHRIPMAPADSITDQLVDPILADLKAPSGSKVLLFVNGMGGTPEAELYIVYNHARARLADAGLEVTRSLVGNYITSLEMQGCSITVLVLDDELTGLWDAPVYTPAMRRGL